MADIETALKELRSFVEDLAIENRDRPAELSNFGKILFGKDFSLFLDVEDSSKFAECVHSLYGAIEEQGTISRTAVERLVRDVVFRLARTKVQSPRNFVIEVEQAIKELRTKLRASPAEWELYAPVIGVAPSELPFQVGRVEFYLADESGAQEFWKRAVQLSEKYSHEGPDQIIADRFRTVFGNRTIARVRVVAVDSEAAKNQAVKSIRRTLDCINFYACRRSEMRLDLGHIEPTPNFLPALQLTISPGLSFQSENKSRLRNAPLRQLSKRLGFDAMSRLLSAEPSDELSDRILTSLQWAGRARAEERREQAFLFFAVALETLLLGSNNRSDLGYKLRIRCAHLIASEEVQIRKHFLLQVKRLYDTRSAIVHSGQFDVIDADLTVIERYTELALLTVLNSEPFRSMKTESEFEDWFETQVLSKSDALPSTDNAGTDGTFPNSL